ncbi:hypothetical protein TFLX_06076 [Thermoflexales bacterium]|nr:hypothetical protein TFLX_06076 [Thermoflexales bacterium]
MDIGSIFFILGGGSLAIGLVAWIVGFIRAVKQQPINDRLNTFCRRE